MGLVDRIERKLESTVGDAFARVFGGSIVPQEVEAMLRREADSGAREVVGGRILAPNDYVITLSMPDYQKVSADPDLTSITFAKHLEGYIHEQGWQTYGDVVVRFEQSPNLHTGQFRARGAVNPDSTAGEPAPAQDRAFTAEPGVAPMTDNPSHRGGQGQGRPADEYYDDRYGRQPDERGQEPAASSPPPEQGGYPPQGEPAYPPRQGYPEQGGYPDQGYPPQPYEQRPPAGYGPPAGGYPDQGYRQAPGGYGPPQGGQPGTALPPAITTTVVSPATVVPTKAATVARNRGRHIPTRAATPIRAVTPTRAATAARRTAGRTRDRSPAGLRPLRRAPGRAGYAEPGYAEPRAGAGYDYGPPAGQAGYGGGYGQGDYPAGGAAVTLQLDDGSGRTYQLREGANVIGRGQDAQFRLPDTGVSRRHLEIRWDGQVALLSDLNSTNGTTVNNAPVQEWQLADGDVIRLGHSEIIVRVH